MDERTQPEGTERHRQVRIMGDKPTRERRLFDAVYGRRDFAEVVHTDRPDFVVRHHGQVTRFGVEVTDVYETEADARIHADPDYITDILAGERYRHRDDERILPLARVTINDPDGNVKQTDVPAIMRPMPTAEQRYSAIGERIRTKSAKLDSYASGLSHINLIIEDHHGDATELGRDDYGLSEVLVPNLRAALRESAFREVFLISTLPGGGRVYRPLRMLSLLGAFYTFCASTGTLPDQDADLDLETHEAAVVYAAVASRTGDGHVTVIEDPDGQLLALQHGTGVGVDSLRGRGLLVSDFADHPTAPAKDMPVRLDATQLDRLARHYQQFAAANDFRCAVQVPVEVDEID